MPVRAVLFAVLAVVITAGAVVTVLMACVRGADDEPEHTGFTYVSAEHSFTEAELIPWRTGN